MVYASLVAVLSLATTALAAPAKRAPLATCANGARLNDARCCQWLTIRDDIQANLLFNQCAENAHQSLRIAFHDAIGRSVSKGRAGGGGADGSILQFPEELEFSENASVNGIAEKIRPFALAHNVSFGDMIQFASAVGMSNCLGGPRVEFHAGRPTASVPAPQFSVPRANETGDTMIPRLEDGGFALDEFVALMASHSIAAQTAIDGTVKGSPFDTTPDTFDTQFFIETSLKGTIVSGVPNSRAEDLSAIEGAFRLQSDGFLARDPRTVCKWQFYVDKPAQMLNDFIAAYGKMSVNGQNDAALVDCSDVIPVPKAVQIKPHFPAGLSIKDVEAVCNTNAFPTLPTDPGAQTGAPNVPPQAANPPSIF